jgi:hypothetical protein
MNRLRLFQFKYHAYNMLLKIVPIALYTSPLSVEALQSRLRLSYYLMLQWQPSHLNGHKLDHRHV